MKFDVTRLKQFWKQMHDRDLSMYDDSFLDNSINTRIRETKLDSYEDYVGYLERNPEEGRNFSESLQIHYSEFFRDPLTFALLEKMIIPELIQKKISRQQKEIRVWSAGCAAGQEAYSIAILLDEIIASTNSGLKYRIFATDLDENILSTARLGRYPADSLKNVSLHRARTCFTRQGENYIVHPALQQYIDFSIFDLLHEERSYPSVSIFGEFDLVFCCNLLIYYKPLYRKVILDKFSHGLSRGGYLVTDNSERSIATAHHYSEVYPSAAIFRDNPRIGNKYENIQDEN